MRVLLIAIITAALVIGFIMYRRRHSGDQLRVEPHAREEIEKAKRR